MTTRDELVGALDRAGFGYALEEAGPGWMLTVPSLGARLLGAGIGEENALWVAPYFGREPWEEGGNAGGQRTWMAPEAGPRGFFMPAGGGTWKVPPELDPGDYRSPTAAGDRGLWRNDFVARSADGVSHRLAILRGADIPSLSTGPGGVAILRLGLRRALENSGDGPLECRAALWDIVQVPCASGTLILIPVAEGSGRGSVRPYYYDLPPGTLGLSPGLVSLWARGGRAWKVGIDAGSSRGSIAALRRERLGEGLVLVALRFDVDPSALYLDRSCWEGETAPSNGDPVQAYGSPGLGDLAFAEIEAQAPAISIAPGERQTVRIALTVATGGEDAMRAFIREELAVEVGWERPLGESLPRSG